MKLNLSISGKVLASINIDPAKTHDDDYLKALRRMLIIRYSHVLKSANVQPQFLVEQTASQKATLN